MTDAPSSAPSVPSAPSAPLTGRSAEEAKHGYKPMPTSDNPPPKKPKEFATAAKAAEDLAGQRSRTGKTSKAGDEIAYRNRDGSVADENQTVSLARAADDLKNHRAIDALAVEAMSDFDVADKVDNLRRENAEQITGQPTGPSQPQIEPSHIDPAADAFERDATAAGVDPELARVLRNPKARQVLESEFTKVAQLQQQHSQQIQIAQHFAQQNWLAGFPELARLPVDRIAPALNQMAKSNPQRFQAALASLRRVGDAAAVSEHYAAQSAHAERQRFEAEAKIQDATFDRMVPRTPQQRQADAMEMVSYAGELGIDQNTLVHLFQTSPILRHASFQKLIHDAITARVTMREARKYKDHIGRNLPPVQRPGTTSGSRSASRGQENLQALARKASSTGSLKDMAALLAASRRGR